MPTYQFGTTQVKEIRLTRREILEMVAENLAARADPSYDFDAKRPIFLWDENDLIVRYVQKMITTEAEPRGFSLSPLPDKK